MKSIALMIAAAGLLFACAPAQPATHPAVSRASLDLECDEAELTQKNIDDTTVEVSGCGKRATYVEECEERFNAGTSAALGMPATTKDCYWVPSQAASK